jgi:hypothetical protein
LAVTVVNPWHWLEEDGSFPLTPAVRRNALRVARVIEYGGPLKSGECRQTLLECTRHPEGQNCDGFLWVVKRSDGRLLAFCELCGSAEFLIAEWQDTPWAGGPAEPLSGHVAVNGEQPS